TGSYCERLPDRADGYIVHSKALKVALAAEDLINIDIGADKGVVPGDFLVVYRENPAGPTFPPSILGDAVVLLTDRDTPTAKTLFSHTDMRLGDHVRMR